MLFLIKTTPVSKNQEINQGTNPENGLTYNATIGDLVNKDTDRDGIPDWEEKLWGTDPTKKETTPGISDSVAIEKLKTEQENSGVTISGSNQSPENLTQTDKFSRDLFATIAAASQDGQPMDQATVDKISSSLADHIQNSPPRKVFVLSDLKVIKDDSVKAIKTYNDTLNNITDKKYPVTESVTGILQRFIVDENNVDVSVLSELDPIIEQKNKIISAIAKMDVPQSLSFLHLDLLNALQRLVENISDIKLYDSDVIVSLSAISQYDPNTILLQSAVDNLKNAIEQKLNN